jgi:hypothetical protein
MYNCIVFGGTGSVGRELVHKLAESKKWGVIIIVVRKLIPDFEKYQLDTRFRILVTGNILDFRTLVDSYVQTTHIHAVFNLLGGEIGQPVKFLKEIEIDWCLEILKLARSLNCELYSKVISAYAKKGRFISIFHLQAEFIEAIKDEKLANISILKPGVLVGRKHNPRFGADCISSLLCCFNRITVTRVAEIELIEAERTLDSNESHGLKIYEHKDMLVIYGDRSK